MLKRLSMAFIGLAFFYLTGIFWIPPEVGMYLYATSERREDYFANKAAREATEKLCESKTGQDLEKCWDENKPRAKALYTRGNL